MAPAENRGGPAADFSFIRYAMCWEDADVLLEGLDVQPGDVCLSIASGGENSFSLLSRNPARVIAVDLSPAQIACVELKAAGYRRLEHDQFLELLGARDGGRRLALYERLRAELSDASRGFWDTHRGEIAAGIGAAGKFERYFALFRRLVLPLIHGRKTRHALFAPRSPDRQADFYDRIWNNRRWRLLFRLFFSRAAMGELGRDPSFFRYVPEGRSADRILATVRHALRELSPAANPYLQWIALGRFATALPHALRPENFEAIRAHLDRLEWRVAPVEQVLAEAAAGSIDRFNMSDVFEYLPADRSDALFESVARAGKSGGRLAYWNMLVPRRPPERLAGRFTAQAALAERLHRRDKACFYSAFRVESLQ